MTRGLEEWRPPGPARAGYARRSRAEFLEILSFFGFGVFWWQTGSCTSFHSGSEHGYNALWDLNNHGFGAVEPSV